jgi:hypothetical protein
MTNTQPNQEKSNQYSFEQLNTWVILITDRREENRNNALLYKTTVEEKPMRTNRTILMRNAIPKVSSSIRFRAETPKIMKEKYNAQKLGVR